MISGPFYTHRQIYFSSRMLRFLWYLCNCPICTEGRVSPRSSSCATTCYKANRSTYAGNVVLVTESFRQKTIAYFPGEDWRALALVLGDTAYHLRGGYTRLATADSTRTNWPSLVIATEDLAHTTVWYLTQVYTKPQKDWATVDTSHSMHRPILAPCIQKFSTNVESTCTWVGKFHNQNCKCSTLSSCFSNFGGDTRSIARWPIQTRFFLILAYKRIMLLAAWIAYQDIISHAVAFKNLWVSSDCIQFSKRTSVSPLSVKIYP